MTVLLAKSVSDLVTLIVSSAATAQSAAVTCAKCIVALTKKSGSEAKARAAMKGKVSDNTIRNAMQIAWCYDLVVEGHATEEWFDALLYTHAVATRQAVAKVGGKQLAEWGLFKNPAKFNVTEFEQIAETGMNKTQRNAAAEEKIESDRLAAKTAKVVAKAATTEPTVSAPVAAATAKPSKTDLTLLTAGKTGQKNSPAPSVTDEFETLVTGIEQFIEAAFPATDDVSREKMRARVTALASAVNASALKLRKKKAA